MKAGTKLIFCAIWLILAQQASAQDFLELINFGYQNSPNNKYKHSDEKAMTSMFYSNLRIPLVMKNKDVLLLGYNATGINIINSDTTRNYEIYSATAVLGYTHNWNERWKTLLLLIPQFSSNFKNVGFDDLQLGGFLIFTYKKKDNLKFKFGVYYNREFFGNLCTPIFGIDWQINDHWQIYGNLPLSTAIDCRINKHIGAGLSFIGPTFSYKLDEFSPKRYIQKNSIEPCLFLDWFITKNIVLTGRAGYTFGRSYREYHEGDQIPLKIIAFQINDHRTQLNDDFKNGYFLEGKLAYRINI
jgi:hypothetical protein